MMYDTPEKRYPQTEISLKQRIQRKLQTDRKILQTKENILKQFQSHNKNHPPKSNYHHQNSYGINRQNYDTRAGKDYFNSFSSHKQILNEPVISETNVLQYESLQNKNFYGFEQWLEFNHKFFPHVPEQCIKNLWKIMRIINYGDNWIPSGLVYEISKVLTQKSNIDKIISLKQTFNQFLRFNHTSDQVNNFRQLKNYSNFEEIQNIYLKVTNKDKKYSQKKITKQYSSMKKLSNNSIDVFQKAHNQSKLKNSRRNKMIYQSLISKQIDEECIFEPKINKYCAQKLFVQESSKAPRPCKFKEKWMIEALWVQDLVQNNSFKAKAHEKSKFQNRTLESIPGVSQYIDRRRQSESNKRKIERYNQRPTSVYRHYN